MKRFVPKLEKLPPPQRRLWNELTAIQNFVLYGGTAIALRLGHRTSIDFDFFSNDSFQPGDLLQAMPWHAEAKPIQSSPNTLSFVLDRGGPVKLSLFGALSMGRVGEPEAAGDTTVLCASLLDLGATKLKTLHDRAESKDYLDIAAILGSGLQLSQLLAAARAIYGEVFNPMIALKALTYFQDGDLPSLPQETKTFLIKATEAVRELPAISRLSDQLAG